MFKNLYRSLQPTILYFPKHFSQSGTFGCLWIRGLSCKNIISRLLFSTMSFLFNFVTQARSWRTPNPVPQHRFTFSVIKYFSETRRLFFQVYLWDLQSSRIVQKLEGHNQAVMCTSCHPTKNIIASSSFSVEKNLILWKAEK